tara:strand:+ start:256 stop:549 length:294 start_codon:yes stop_codon:yes gene_type:complete
MESICSEQLADVNADSMIHGGAVLSCLVKSMQEIKDQTCKDDVKRYIRSAATFWKANKSLQTACSIDVNQYCNGVMAGSGAVNDCLVENIEKHNGGE